MDISQKPNPDFTRQQTINRLISQVAFFKGKWEAIPLMKEVSIHTLKKDLLYLKKEGLLDTMGKGKSTVYIIRDQAKA